MTAPPETSRAWKSYSRRADAGLCILCGNRPPVTTYHCQPCREKFNANMKVIQTRRRKRLAEERAASRVPGAYHCSLCGAANHNKRRCPTRQGMR